MAAPRTPNLRTTLNVDEALDLDPLRLGSRSGDPEPPLAADPNLSQWERDSVLLTIQDHSDSPRQGRSVLKWLDEWKRKWEKMCKLVCETEVKNANSESSS